MVLIMIDYNHVLKTKKILGNFDLILENVIFSTITTIQILSLLISVLKTDASSVHDNFNFLKLHV